MVDDADFVPLKMMDESAVQMVDDDIVEEEYVNDVNVVDDAGVDESAMVEEGVSMVGGSKNMGVEVVVLVVEDEMVEVAVLKRNLSLLKNLAGSVKARSWKREREHRDEEF